MVSGASGKEITMKIIAILILAVVFIILAWIIGQTDDDKYDMIEASATIDRVVYSDTGNAMYYVTFLENGKTITGQSIYYSSSTKALNGGDDVAINYFYTKGGNVRVIILDNTLKPCMNSLKSLSRVLLYISVILFIVAGYLFAGRIA